MVRFMAGMVVVISAEMPTMWAACSSHRGHELLGRHVAAQVDHLEAGALEHHRHQVLADVVQVALGGADHDHAQVLAGARPRW